MNGSKSWMVTRKDDKMQATEMRFLNRVKGCIRSNLMSNYVVQIELNICALPDKVTACR